MSQVQKPPDPSNDDREKTIQSLIERLGMSRKQAEQMLAQQRVDEYHSKRETLQDD